MLQGAGVHNAFDLGWRGREMWRLVGGIGGCNIWCRLRPRQRVYLSASMMGGIMVRLTV